MNDPIPWATTFCGRDKDMAVLMNAWERVTATVPDPQVVVLLAESGLGKTRLAQEFYNILSTRFDRIAADGYWPDALERRGNDLLINPDPAGCQAKNRMPFLWWGLRAQDPTARHALPGEALRAGIAILRPHLENVLRASKLEEIEERSKKLLGQVTKDAATQTLDTLTFGLLGALRTAREGLAGLAEIRRERDQLRSNIDLGSIVEAERASLIDTTVADLEQLLTRSSIGRSPVPAVLLIDDAQFAESDPALCELVIRIVRIARADSWPLLVLVTHWEREWYEALELKGTCFAWRLSSALDVKWAPYPLSKAEDLGPLVDAGLPGIAAEQRALVLTKADGNPRLLDEMLRYLRARPRFFKSRDIRMPMTTAAMEELENTQFELHALVEDRFAHMAKPIQLALALSALQGIRFLEPATLDAVRLLSSHALDEVLMDRAERPHAFISRLSNGIAEFNQRVYRDVALARLPDLLDEQQARRSIAWAIRNVAGADGEFGSLDKAQKPIAWTLGATFLVDSGATETDLLLAARCFARSAAERMDDFDGLTACKIAESFLDAVSRGALSFEHIGIADATILLESLIDGRNVESADVLAMHLSEELKRQGRVGAEAARAWNGVAALYVARKGPLLAIEMCESALESARAAHASESTPATSRELVIALIKQAGVVWDVRRTIEETEALLAESMDVAQALCGTEKSLESSSMLFWACQKWTRLQQVTGRLIEAQSAAQKALQQAYATQADYPGIKSRRLVLVALSGVGNITGMLEGYQAGRLPLQQALEIAREIVRVRRTPAAEREVMMCELMLAQISDYSSQGQLVETALAKARSQSERYSDPEALRDLWHVLIAAVDMRNHLTGDNLLLLKESVSVARRIHCTGDMSADAFGRIVHSLIRIGDHLHHRLGAAVAERPRMEALEAARAYWSRYPTAPEACECLVSALLGLTDVYEQSDRIEKARQLTEEALEIARGALSKLPSVENRISLLNTRIRAEGFLARSSDEASQEETATAAFGFTYKCGRMADSEDAAGVIRDLALLLGPMPSDLHPAITVYGVPFYPGWRLFRLDWPATSGDVSLFSFCLHRDGIAVPLDGTSRFLHEISRSTPVRINHATVLPWVRFFCEFVGAPSPFVIASSASDIPFINMPAADMLNDLRSIVTAPVIVSEPSSENAAWRVDAFVVHSDHLFEAHFKIAPGGPVEMLSDHPVMRLERTRAFRGRDNGEWNLMFGWPFGDRSLRRLELRAYLAKLLGYGRVPADRLDNPVGFLTALAEGGESKAALALGQLYKEGRLFRANPAAAIQWMLVAADRGETLAMSCLGFMYLAGRGVKANLSVSERWLSRAVASGGHEFAGFTADDKLVWVMRQLNSTIGFTWETSLGDIALVVVIARDALEGSAQDEASVDRSRSARDGESLVLSNGEKCLRWSEDEQRWMIDIETARRLTSVARIMPDGKLTTLVRIIQHLMRIMRHSVQWSPSLAEALVITELEARGGVNSLEEIADSLENPAKQVFARAQSRLLEADLVKETAGKGGDLKWVSGLEPLV